MYRKGDKSVRICDGDPHMGVDDITVGGLS